MPPKRNIKLTLAYDGSEFHGWQLQPALPTVQATINAALRRITGDPDCEVYASGRTDAGVHALGQVAHFKTTSLIPCDGLRRALNALLPASVRVFEAREMPAEFHARWHVASKSYRYRLLRAEICPPFVWRYVYHYPFPLAVVAMQTAARLFVGDHDFTSFSAVSSEEEADEGVKNPVRTILYSELSEDRAADELVYEIRGRSFLRHMVRKILGTLLEVGKGRLAVEDIPGIFEARDRTRSGPTVPPSGLYLVEVEYPEPWK